MFHGGYKIIMVITIQLLMRIFSKSTKFKHYTVDWAIQFYVCHSINTIGQMSLTHPISSYSALHHSPCETAKIPQMKETAIWLNSEMWHLYSSFLHAKTCYYTTMISYSNLNTNILISMQYRSSTQWYVTTDGIMQCTSHISFSLQMHHARTFIIASFPSEA